MISEQKINHNDKRNVEKELRKQQFISKTAISGMYYLDAIKLIGYNAYKYNSKELKEIFERTPSLRCIKLNISGSISYWYYIEDLKKLPKKI